MRNLKALRSEKKKETLGNTAVLTYVPWPVSTSWWRTASKALG